jgi:hypothetical protein
VAVEGERQRLAHARIVERLHGVVHGDADQARGRRVLHDQLVAERLADRVDLGRGHGAEFDVRAPRADRRRARHRDEHERRPAMRAVVPHPTPPPGRAGTATGGQSSESQTSCSFWFV